MSVHICFLQNEYTASATAAATANGPTCGSWHDDGSNAATLTSTDDYYARYYVKHAGARHEWRHTNEKADGNNFSPSHSTYQNF